MLLSHSYAVSSTYSSYFEVVLLIQTAVKEQNIPLYAATFHLCPCLYLMQFLSLTNPDSIRR